MQTSLLFSDLNSYPFSLIKILTESYDVGEYNYEVKWYKNELLMSYANSKLWRALLERQTNNLQNLLPWIVLINLIYSDIHFEALISEISMH